MKKLIILIVFFTTLAINLPAANLTFSLSEEKNVNDIPFDTELIASLYLLNNANDEKKNETEKYVNDIPFNTEMIAANSLLKDQQQFLSLMEESYVNDIPFNTELLAANYLVNNTDLSMDEEATADDIPFNTMCFLLDKASLCDVRTQQITRDSFTLILQLPGKEAFTFSDPEEFKKSFMKCVLETPPMEFRACIQGIQHDFPQTLPSKR
ncbi:MAG: hypothetical protein U5Q03_12945 [Bacteroidota bacterium]|nr:hypothetical protein [Bacteroidota bacterium]